MLTNWDWSEPDLVWPALILPPLDLSLIIQRIKRQNRLFPPKAHQCWLPMIWLMIQFYIKISTEIKNKNADLKFFVCFCLHFLGIYIVKIIYFQNFKFTVILISVNFQHFDFQRILSDLEFLRVVAGILLRITINRPKKKNCNKRRPLSVVGNNEYFRLKC